MIFLNNLIKINNNYGLIYLYVKFFKGFGKIFYKININKDILFSLKFIIYFIIKINFLNKRYFFNLYNIYIEIFPFKFYYKNICINTSFLFLLIFNFLKINLNKFLFTFYFYNKNIFLNKNIKRKIYFLYKNYNKNFNKKFLIITYYNLKFFEKIIKNYKITKTIKFYKFFKILENLKGI